MKEQTDKEKLEQLQAAYDQRYKELQDAKIKNKFLEGQNAALKARHNEDVWEHRRYEIAKQMLPSMNHPTISEDVLASLQYADDLIKRLKGE